MSGRVTPQGAVPAPKTAGLAMIRTLGLVATLCAVAIVSAYRGTLEAVKANKQTALERAVFGVVPGGARVEALRATPGGISPSVGGQGEDGAPFYAVYDAAGVLKGFVAEAAAKGYADVVRVLYAYDPEREVINGIGVISQRETPGIGDKIITDATFLQNFKALDVRLSADRRSLANAIKVVKHGTKKAPWEIDAIAGATVTSKAVGKGIDESAGRLIPLLAPHAEGLKQREQR